MIEGVELKEGDKVVTLLPIVTALGELLIPEGNIGGIWRISERDQSALVEFSVKPGDRFWCQLSQLRKADNCDPKNMLVSYSRADLKRAYRMALQYAFQANATHPDSLFTSGWEQDRPDITTVEHARAAMRSPEWQDRLAGCRTLYEKLDREAVPELEAALARETDVHNHPTIKSYIRAAKL